MCNNIKSKTLGVHKRKLILVLLLTISMFTMLGCDYKGLQVTTYEFELLSCYIEYRNQTNMYGGILRTDEYLHYAYTNGNGKVIFDEMPIGYHVDFQLTEGTPKIIMRSSSAKKEYIFQLTRDMYNNLNSGQK